MYKKIILLLLVFTQLFSSSVFFSMPDNCSENLCPESLVKATQPLELMDMKNMDECFECTSLKVNTKHDQKETISSCCLDTDYKVVVGRNSYKFDSNVLGVVLLQEIEPQVAYILSKNNQPSIYIKSSDSLETIRFNC